MQKPYKNPNSNARFAAAGFCAVKFMDRGVKFFALQNAGFFATKFGSTKFCGAEPRARDTEFRGFKFRDEKFSGANFATCGTEFLEINFRDTEFCKSKFKVRGFKFYKARLRETGFLARTAKFYAAKFRGNALLKFAAAKGLRRSPSLCAAASFKFIALQNARFFATKFGEAEFCDVKFYKARSRRAKFYAAEFAADGAKFCGAKRRGAGA